MKPVIVARSPWQRVASIWGFIALAVGATYLGTRFTLHLVSLAGERPLVPVSSEDILGAISLALVLYTVGILFVLRFPIPQSVGWYSLFFAIRVLMAVLLAVIFQYDDKQIGVA